MCFGAKISNFGHISGIFWSKRLRKNSGPKIFRTIFSIFYFLNCFKVVPILGLWCPKGANISQTRQFFAENFLFCPKNAFLCTRNKLKLFLEKIGEKLFFLAVGREIFGRPGRPAGRSPGPPGRPK